MDLVNVSTLPPHVRLAAADRVRTSADFALPELAWFNTDPCPAHTSIDEGASQIPPCRRCGIRFRRHQRVGVAWLYLRGKGLIADQVGTGKSAQAAGLVAAIKQAGELDTGKRVIVICRPAALEQWETELRRFLPRLSTITATGTRSQRQTRYASAWHILVTGYQMLCNDAELLAEHRVALVVVDDVDPLRNPATTTAYTIKRLARRSDRAVILTATPLQKRLPEMHSVLEPIGGFEIFGSERQFRRRYVREEKLKVYSPRAGRFVYQTAVTGYQNLDEFIERLRPMTLRRTAADITDVDLPAIAPPNNVYLDLYPAQKERYLALRRGVLKILKTEGAKVKRAQAVAQFLYGAQICAGLVTLGEPDGPHSSVKLDWVERTLVDGDLSEEKVVVFCQFTNTAAALRDRLDKAGVGNVVIWGRESDKTARAQARDRFWDDPGCRVLIGTSAIEQSLNLQCARHLINIDQLMNPARMTQLAGRIRRDGSAYTTVYITNLLARGTQEDGYLDLLSREQALADHVWGEANQLYEQLNPLALLQLIGHTQRRHS